MSLYKLKILDYNAKFKVQIVIKYSILGSFKNFKLDQNKTFHLGGFSIFVIGIETWLDKFHFISCAQIQKITFLWPKFQSRTWRFKLSKHNTMWLYMWLYMWTIASTDKFIQNYARYLWTMVSYFNAWQY